MENRSNKWVDYSKVFAVPKTYKPPQSYYGMANSLEYPNLNSSEYRTKTVQMCQALQPFYDIICVSEAGYYILVTNEYQSRLWYGNIFAFTNFDKFMLTKDINETLYKTYASSNITNLKLLNDDYMLFSEINGKLQIYSLKDGIAGRYLIFKTCSLQGHNSAINALDIMRSDKKKAVTGCGTGDMKVFDIGSEDIKLKTARKNAHLGNVSGISSSATNPNLYVSCSFDRSVLIWDERERRPATGIYENHKFNFSTIYWTSNEENKELVLTGDYAGWINMFDVRKPKTVLGSFRINKNIIHGFECRKSRVVITSNAYTSEVYEMQDANIKAIFEEQTSDITRSAKWITDDEFVVVGWNRFSATYNLLSA